MKKLYKIDDVDILFTTVSVIKVAESEDLRTWKETKCPVQVRETKIPRSCKRPEYRLPRVYATQRGKGSLVMKGVISKPVRHDILHVRVMQSALLCMRNVRDHSYSRIRAVFFSHPIVKERSGSVGWKSRRETCL